MKVWLTWETGPRCQAASLYTVLTQPLTDQHLQHKTFRWWLLASNNYVLFIVLLNKNLGVFSLTACSSLSSFLFFSVMFSFCFLFLAFILFENFLFLSFFFFLFFGAALFCFHVHGEVEECENVTKQEILFQNNTCWEGKQQLHLTNWHMPTHHTPPPPPPPAIDNAEIRAKL